MGEHCWFLEGLQKNGKKWRVKLEDFPFLLGRADSSHLTLSSKNVSRIHAKIVQKKDDLFIEDNNSTNGTMLNGRIINKITRINESDIINICDFEYKLIKTLDEIVDDRTIISTGESPIGNFSSEHNLTPRESELLSYLIKGVSTKEIANSMFISPGTAKNHILNLLKKTETHSRIELITAYNTYSG